MTPRQQKNESVVYDWILREAFKEYCCFRLISGKFDSIMRFVKKNGMLALIPYDFFFSKYHIIGKEQFLSDLPIPTELCFIEELAQGT